MCSFRGNARGGFKLASWAVCYPSTDQGEGLAMQKASGKKQRAVLLFASYIVSKHVREGHLVHGLNMLVHFPLGVWIVHYAAATKPKPKDWLKVAGRPWIVTSSDGALDERALRARRSSQLRRQCARCALVCIC
jgi:hypothetical protein